MTDSGMKNDYRLFGGTADKRLVEPTGFYSHPDTINDFSFIRSGKWVEWSIFNPFGLT